MMLLHIGYFRQFFDTSNLTLHDNMCLWPGWVVGRLDVTLITVGWRDLLATGMNGCGGHCHTQSEVRPEACVCLYVYHSTVRPSHHWTNARERANLGGQFRKILELKETG